ncbi:hypothetical protein [Halolamina sediminis]|jgi:NAD+ dependent glucose-6-phosphate dehydrogenase
MYDFTRKYYWLKRTKEVLGYEPVDNSAEFTFEREPKDDTE